MGVVSLLTELGSAMVSFLQTFLPGVVTAVVQTFDTLAFTSTEGGQSEMTAVFGWMMIGMIITLGVWLFKLIGRKAFGTK